MHLQSCCWALGIYASAHLLARRSLLYPPIAGPTGWPMNHGNKGSGCMGEIKIDFPVPSQIQSQLTSFLRKNDMENDIFQCKTCTALACFVLQPPDVFTPKFDVSSRDEGIVLTHADANPRGYVECTRCHLFPKKWRQCRSRFGMAHLRPTSQKAFVPVCACVCESGWVCVCGFPLRLASSRLRLRDNRSLLRSTHAARILCISQSLSGA